VKDAVDRDEFTSARRRLSSLRFGRRRFTGSALSGAGPGLFLLLVFAVFPVLDLIFLGISYYSCITLNDLQLREAVKVSKSEATAPNGVIAVAVPNQWRRTMIGGLARLAQDPLTNVSYSFGKGNVYVTVVTSVAIQPLLTIPFFPQVPGLGAPISCSISGTRVLENANSVFY